MAARDYESSPVSDKLNLEDIINGLAGDLRALRAGEITVGDAQARAVLAKQIFNGVRIYLNGMALLSGSAKEVKEIV
jgi:hypothetical protein